jgi:hypothetical protein
LWCPKGGVFLGHHKLGTPTYQTMSLLGHGILIDATKSGSGISRYTRIWPNLIPEATLVEARANLPAFSGLIETTLITFGLADKTTSPGSDGYVVDPPNLTESYPWAPLPQFGSRPHITQFCIHNGCPCRGMLYHRYLPTSPSAEVSEDLTGFQVSTTTAPGRTQLQHIHLNTYTFNVPTSTPPTR